MGNYASYSRKQFEYFLIQIRMKNPEQLGYWKDITDSLENETKRTYWESVYMFSTRNKNLVVLIYSSVDRRTTRTREKGSDAVRVIYRLESKGKVWYKKVKKHYRVETLFTNLENTLKEATKGVFNLDRNGWHTSISNVDSD